MKPNKKNVEVQPTVLDSTEVHEAPHMFVHSTEVHEASHVREVFRFY